MRNLKTLFFAFSIPAGLLMAKAEKAPDVVKKIVKATSAFTDYEIKFEKYFKFQSGKDTTKETFHSVVYRTEIEYNIGWHRIYHMGTDQLKSLVASNNKGVARLNIKDNQYFHRFLADDQKMVMSTIKTNLYTPITRVREDYKDFDIVKSDKQIIWLQKVDTLKENNGKVKLFSRTLIGINAETYIPESEESWTNFKNGNVQYYKYKLLEYHFRPKNQFDAVLKTSDSLIRYIDGHINGDSLKEKNKKYYKQPKPGDSAFMFMGTLHEGNKAFVLSDIKDSIIVLDFFYTTCVPCIAAVQEINKFYARNSGRGVAVLGIDAFSSDWPNLDGFLSEKNITYPIVKTREDLKLEYGVTGFPRMFVIKNGIIVKIYYGSIKDIDQLLQKQIDELLK